MNLTQTQHTRPIRRWALVARAINGKSTFAMKMRAPISIIDTDFRASQVAHHAKEPDKVYSVDGINDFTDVRDVASRTADVVRQSKSASLVVDNLSGIINPLVTEAMIENAAGENRNKSAAFQKKALAMRFLQDRLGCLGTDVLWIWHIEDRSFDGSDTEYETLSKAEQAALMRNLNARLEVIVDETTGAYSMKVTNLRPEKGQPTETVIPDESGCWEGMPEKIDAFLKFEVRTATPPPAPAATTKPAYPFRDRDSAITHAVDVLKVFPDKATAEKAYLELKDSRKPQKPSEMFAIWAEKLHELELAKAPVAAAA